METEVGYSGGESADPTYSQVCSGKTGHTEVVKVSFDSSKVTYTELLKLFWSLHNPGQKSESQYKSVIFYSTPDQKEEAFTSIEELKEAGVDIATDLLPAKVFHKAEEYHQQYYEKSGHCSDSAQKKQGSDDLKSRPEEFWKKKLTSEQFRVLRQKGTEKAFTGKYWNNKESGRYLCAACGNELFLSANKFESGTGWPSFDRPVNNESIEYHEDGSWFTTRTEVTCRKCGSHLGHVFDDGPKNTTGKRYCINSVSLDFEKE
ncbi:MAG: peptide-methionine (R)-S-oxide reductase MsrB [Planctomycetes bacterium]|nr:peptide-methionine (R)-S-oxide reductase MsrB [Planctomycetota bacterium]